MTTFSEVMNTKAGQVRLLALVLSVVALGLSAAAMDRYYGNSSSAVQMAVAASVVGVVIALFSLFSIVSDYHSRWGARYNRLDTLAIMTAVIILALGAGGLFFAGYWSGLCDDVLYNQINTICSLARAASFMELLASIAFAACIMLHFGIGNSPIIASP